MIRLLIFVFMLSPGFVAAENWPKLVEVTDVSTNDHLNIRQDPTTRSAVIGRFEPSQSGIEVIGVSSDGAWAQVNIGEGTGWASLRYLRVSAGQDTVPETLYCNGTEPFWSAAFANNNIRFSSPETEPLQVTAANWKPSANRTGRYSKLTKSNGSIQIAALLDRSQCSDGMSDRAYGLTLDLVVSSNDLNAHLTGCCSLTN